MPLQSEGDANTNSQTLNISISLDSERTTILRRAFPNANSMEAIAAAVAQLATDEFLDLLAGKKRYMSLSHQYIEWISQIYEVLLPDEEYTYEALTNRFNFPPGTASYMSRILRSRQNAGLLSKAHTALASKLKRDLEKYEAIPENDKMDAGLRSVQLTIREYEVLHAFIISRIALDELMEFPKVKYRSREFIGIEYHIAEIRRLVAIVEEHLLEGRI